MTKQLPVTTDGQQARYWRRWPGTVWHQVGTCVDRELMEGRI